MKARRIVGAALLVLLACRDERPADSATPAQSPAPLHIDSVFPIEEEIRRFKAARNGASAAELNNASKSRDALVARFMQALEARDTAEMRAMVMNAAEFIDLYYPTSVYARPPYRQSPEINWLLLRQNSEKGMNRALERFGGMPPHFQDYTCKGEPRVEGANRFWEDCVVRWSPAPDVPSPIRAFSSIIERGGRFKFVSYGNDL